jgi:uncharacterized protein YyaL (SSP411 family)
MAKESFMDTAVARIMNENFVCIKVDREERPDIDNIYTSACQLITGRAGWPLNAFALPDGKPFFAGTYYSRQSWISLLDQIGTAWKTQHNKVTLQAQGLTNGIARLEFSLLTDSASELFDKSAYKDLFESLYRRIDLSAGGLKGTPKFPSATSLEFLFQYYYLTKDKRALDAATHSLDRMALGGIYDQVGGGFSRYAVDSLWKVPHFEKMLYDNAQLISVYAHAYQLTRNDFFKTIIQETTAFVKRDLKSPDGGYYSSLNADTKEGEGVFYTWNAAELKKITADQYDLFSGYYNVSDEGNWRGDRNILFASMPPAQFAQKNARDPAQFIRQLTTTKQALLQERNKRDKPSVDDKVLTSWNAMLIKGFLDAYAALGEDAYLQEALSVARFLEQKMIQPNGKLWRNYKDGRATVNAFLDDYANLAKAFLRLYQLTFDKHWLDQSMHLANYAADKLYDEESGMFYYAENKPGETLIRKLELTDNAIPSSNAVMGEVLYNLGITFEQTNYIEMAQRMFSRVSAQLQKGAVNFYASWCYLPAIHAYGNNEVAIVGMGALQKNRELQQNYLPFAIFMGSVSNENLPLLEGKRKYDQTLIYVCTKKTCKRPVSQPLEALDQLVK